MGNSTFSIIASSVVAVFQIGITYTLWANGRKGDRQNKKNDSFERRINLCQKDIAVNRNETKHNKEEIKELRNG